MKKTFQTNLILFFLLTILTLCIVNSTLITTSILDYTNLFFTRLFPASFIIFIISSILIDYGFINFLSKTKLNGNILYVTIMSLISGFPSGAKYTKELLDKKLITEDVANYLISYTSFPNPIFVLGSIATILTKKIAINLLLSIIISNFILAIFLKPKKTKNFLLQKNTNPNFSKSLSLATISACKTLLIVYSSSLFFYLITVLLNNYFTFKPLHYVILNGIFDLTKGIFSTIIIPNITLKSVIILIFLSFGSISIHIQIKSIISDTLIKYKNYLLGRFLATALSIIIFFLIN